MVEVVKRKHRAVPMSVASELMASVMVQMTETDLNTLEVTGETWRSVAFALSRADQLSQIHREASSLL